MSALDPLLPRGRTVVGGFESTYLPAFGVDALDLTHHAQNWRGDLDALLDAGVRHLRYPLRWHRIEPGPGQFDWRETDAVLGHLRDRGATVIVDLVHHTSYPDWLVDGFRSPRFGPAFLRYAEAVATRYPWLPAYTVFNEPFATLFLAGHQGLWPPYDTGDAGFARLLRSVLPAVVQAARAFEDLLHRAHHVWVDTAEHHTGTGPGHEHALLSNDRRHVVLDLALGHDLDPARPYLRRLVEAGGESLLDLTPLRVHLLGLDYYSHSEWFYDDAGGHAPSPRPVGFARVAELYGRRYGLPMMLSETNLRGLPSDRVSWLRHMLEQYEVALSRGVDLRGFCWFPQVDSCDWDTLLALCRGRADPVGVLSLGADGSRRRSVLTEAWEAVVAGARHEDLPAYRFQPPCDAQLAGLTPLMSHWPWREPPWPERVPPLRVSTRETETDAPPAGAPSVQEVNAVESDLPPDLVVISHLRWPWVWQRPQHLISRLARLRTAGGARTYFVEEPLPTDVAHAVLRSEELGDVTRVWLEVPGSEEEMPSPNFDDPRATGYGDLLAGMVARRGRPASPDAWLYTPMALDLARHLEPGRVVYDVMDDLSSFLNAPKGLTLRQQRLLATADVVFTGGRSLHRSVRARRQHDVHLFPSGVESSHFEAARALRRARPGRVAGYVGVFDERIDLDLLATLAAHLPDWTIQIVGPIFKIEESAVPRAANIDYVGMTPYERLPEVMAGFDVALMPFALNEATRSISPTKTLEYLAAGLPVVSTRVADVVADYSSVVHLADDGVGFAAACRRVVEHDRGDRDRRLRPILARQQWDTIAAGMARLLEATTVRDAVAGGEATA
ncbi:family 1 glycosylhydrolase [Georgenia sp. SYP-B2076]|uniref:family 1 glycosylhydrolase n=1 Tax=Georgenia sp. SYP-B2076 TaxID=2495881 RepID=UPI0013E05BE9|nr:family 1 glycosylhydrolase [Georgenia sp. SYP-B2076]